jgi:cytochrome c553
MRAATTLILACLITLPLGSHAGDVAAGKTKAAACAACHGPDGKSSNPEWPNLAGQGVAYLVKQLEEFKAGKRANPIMSAQAAALSEADMADVAAYFGSQKGALGVADPAQVALGERIYQGGNQGAGVAACMSCHGPAGSGNPMARYPAVSGQHAEYVAKSLREFRSGVRNNDPNAMMRRVTERMTDREIDAVAQYIAGLHG